MEGEGGATSWKHDETQKENYEKMENLRKWQGETGKGRRRRRRRRRRKRRRRRRWRSRN